MVPEIAERYPILGVNPRSFLAYQASCRTTCDALVAIAPHTATLTGAGEPQGLVGVLVSPNIFDVLGIALERGRPFEEAEATSGGSAVAIITHGFWQGRFGGDTKIVGRRISLDGQPIEVIGVSLRRSASRRSGTATGCNRSAIPRSISALRVAPSATHFVGRR